MGFVIFKGYGETHTAPVGVPTLSTLSVGSIVKIDEGGTPVEYLVVNQGIPEGSALYDASCNGTWLLRKELTGLQKWDSTDNDYELSDIHAYLNGDFLDLYDYNVRNLIKEVKIPYHKGNGSYGSMASCAEGLPVKAFLLGGYEVGFTTDTHLNFPVDGAVLAYFKNSSNRIAEISGTRYRWWTRSANTHNTNGVWAVETNGTHVGDHTYANDGVRPAVILPSNTPIIQNDDGSASLIVPETTEIPLSELEEGSVVMINENGSAVPFYLAKQNYESSMNGEGRTLFVRKDCYSKRQWHSTERNTYHDSDIDTWLNSDYKTLLTSNVQELIDSTTFVYTKSGSTMEAAELSRSVFLLSMNEIGADAIATTNKEGSTLPVSDLLKIAYMDGSAVGQWTRTLYSSAYSTIGYSIVVTADGTAVNYGCTREYGIRPAFTLPSTMYVAAQNTDGSYTLIA